MAIAIVDAKRTPQGAFQGALAALSASQLGGHVLSALSVDHTEAIYMGCVLQAGVGQAPALQAARHAGIEASATTINKVCGSGMKAITMAFNDISLGHYQTLLAGGMESMSRAPYLLNRSGYRFGHAQIFDHLMKDGLEDAYTHFAMGKFADQTAHHYKISRSEQEDYVRESFEKAKLASWDNERIILDTLTDDEPLLRVKPEKFSRLSPAFSEDGTVTAATSSSLADGAAAVCLTKTAQQPLAWIEGYAEHIGAPQWFTTAPIAAIKKLCAQLGWLVESVDIFEINEAFAVVPLVAMKEMGIRRDKINPKGGACVLGHPIGASGARIVVTLAHAMKERGLKKGIACACIGGGEAIAIALSR